MKNKTFGRGTRHRDKAPIAAARAPLWYISARQNGNKTDEPKRAFPKDGESGWEAPPNQNWYRYTEGPQDRAWMEDCDRNYIARLERDGCSNETEERDLAEWRETHAQDYARGPGAQTGAEDDPEAARGDFVRARYEHDAAYREPFEEEKQREAREAAQRQEAEYQATLSDYRSRADGTGLVEAIKAKASKRLLDDLLTLDPEHIDALDEDGDSALHAATETGDLELVKQLIKAGADVFAKNSLGETARDLAVAAKNKKIAHCLQIQEQQAAQSSISSFGSKGSGSTDLPSPPTSLASSGGRVVAAPLVPHSPGGSQSWQIHPDDLHWDAQDRRMHLGDGGFGTVFKGTYTQVKGFVAIKALHPFRASAASAQELRQEAAMMADLRSDFVVRFYGVCEWNAGQTLLVMECCSHGALYDYLHPDEKQPDATPPHLSWPTRYALARDMTCGLDYLHRHNPLILHRDLKSLNVLLSEDREGQLQAKLTDFGLAKMKNESASQSKRSQSSVGTVPWMAPELLIEDEDDQLAPASRETDVYALGMVLWELASGQVPFAGKNIGQLTVLLVQQKRPKIPTDCPAPFSSLIGRCWAQRATDRPSAQEVIRDIDALVAEPTQGRGAAEPLEHNRLLFSS